MPAGAPSPSQPTSTGWPSSSPAEPAPDWFLVDRYWAGARLKDIDALLIVNKSDVRLRGSRGGTRQLPQPWPSLRRGVGAHRRGSCGAARRARRRRNPSRRPVGRRQILARQRARARRSGANRRADARRWRAVTPRPRRAAIVCRRAARPNRLAVIDAPGVRDFAPPASLVRAAERGFVEIHERARRLPVQRLPASRGAGLRGAQCRARPRSRRAATRAIAGCVGCTRSCA